MWKSIAIYMKEERGSREVKYAGHEELLEKIIRKYHPEWLIYDDNSANMDMLVKDALERYTQVKNAQPEEEKKPKKKTGGKKKSVVLKVERTASEAEASKDEKTQEPDKEIAVEPEAGKDG